MIQSLKTKNTHKKQEVDGLYYESNEFLDTPDRKSSELTSRVNSGNRGLRELNNI